MLTIGEIIGLLLVMVTRLGSGQTLQVVRASGHGGGSGGSSGHGRSARQAVAKRRVDVLMGGLVVGMLLVAKTGHHVRRETRCAFFGNPW